MLGPNGLLCNDGSACTSGDACNAGTCQGVLAVCNDQNPCTNDACNAVSGGCTYLANSASCTDNNVKHCWSSIDICVSALSTIFY